VSHCAGDADRVNRQRAVRCQVIAPVNALDAVIQGVLVGRGEFIQQHQDATGQSRPQACAIADR
jgi:hypothetical protein